MPSSNHTSASSDHSSSERPIGSGLVAALSEATQSPAVQEQQAWRRFYCPRDVAGRARSRPPSIVDAVPRSSASRSTAERRLPPMLEANVALSLQSMTKRAPARPVLRQRGTAHAFSLGSAQAPWPDCSPFAGILAFQQTPSSSTRSPARGSQRRVDPCLRDAWQRDPIRSNGRR